MFFWLLFVIFENSRAEHECQTSRQGRIVGGFGCSVVDYPFFVSIQTRSGFKLCGGSIIHPNWVLSAAHCFVTLSDPRQIQVESSTELRMVIKIVTHEGFDTNMANDISMIKVSRSFTKSKTVKLPASVNQTENCTMALVMGWGKQKSTVFTRSGETSFRCVYLFVTETKFCMAFSKGIQPESILCTTWPEGGKSPCSGDSGGPLLCQDDSGDFVIGVVSSGFGCGLPLIPTTYTRVDYHLDFIKDAIDSANVDGKSLILLCVCTVASFAFI